MLKIEVLYSLLGISVLFGLCCFIMLKNCEKYADILIKEVSKRDKIISLIENFLIKKCSSLFIKEEIESFKKDCVLRRLPKCITDGFNKGELIELYEIIYRGENK